MSNKPKIIKKLEKQRNISERFYRSANSYQHKPNGLEPFAGPGFSGTGMEGAPGFPGSRETGLTEGTEASMHRYEMEIPGILTWRFKTLEEAVNRTLPVMVRSVPSVRISRIGEDGRPKVVLRLDADGGTCPFCRGMGSVIRIRSEVERYDALKICRDCRRSFREYPSRICGLDPAIQG